MKCEHCFNARLLSILSVEKRSPTSHIPLVAVEVVVIDDDSGGGIDIIVVVEGADEDFAVTLLLQVTSSLRSICTSKPMVV